MFTFSKKKGPVLGVDINSDTITLVQLDAASRGSQLLNFGSQPTPPNTIREGLMADPETIGSVLGTVLDQTGLSAGPAPILNVSVPGQSVVVRLMPVPTGMPPEELADVVSQEAINHVPFPISEANLDWSIMPATERDDADGVRRVDVILVAIQKNIVDTYWRMAETAGCKIGRIDTTSLSVIRALIFSNYLSADNELHMLVNIRQDATDINLVRNAMPLFSRSVLLGMETLGEAIARSLEIPISEAFSLLPQIQLSGMTSVDPKLSQAAQIVRTVFGDITDEVSRSLEFYRSQVGEVQIKQLLVCGQGSSIPQVDQFISNRLNIPAELVDPLRNVTFDPVLVPDHQRLGLTLVLGNQIDPAWNQTQSVDLDLNKDGPSADALDGIEQRPTVQVYSSGESKWFLPVLGAGVALLLIVAATWAYWSQYDIPKKKAELNMLTQEIDQEKKRLQNTPKLKDSNAQLQSKKEILDSIVKRTAAFAPLLENISHNTPTGVQLSKILVNGERLQIRGHAIGFTEVSHFAINLGGSPYMTEAGFSWAKRQGTTGGDPRIIDFQVVGIIPNQQVSPQIAVNPLNEAGHK